MDKVIKVPRESAVPKRSAKFQSSSAIRLRTSRLMPRMQWTYDCLFKCRVVMNPGRKLSYEVPTRVSMKTCGLMEPIVEVSKASHRKGWRDSGTSESRPKNSPGETKLTIVCRS